MPERGVRSKGAPANSCLQALRRSRVCPQADEYMDEPGTPPPYQVNVLPLSRKMLPGCRAPRCVAQVFLRQALTRGKAADPQEQTLEDSPAPCTPHLEALAGHASHFQARGLSRACARTSCYMVHLAWPRIAHGSGLAGLLCSAEAVRRLRGAHQTAAHLYGPPKHSRHCAFCAGAGQLHKRGKHRAQKCSVRRLWKACKFQPRSLTA